MLVGSCTASLSLQCYTQLQFAPRAAIVTGCSGVTVCRTAAMSAVRTQPLFHFMRQVVFISARPG